MKGMISNICMFEFEFDAGRGATLCARTDGSTAHRRVCGGVVQTANFSLEAKDFDNFGAALAEGVFSKRGADCTTQYSQLQE